MSEYLISRLINPDARNNFLKSVILIIKIFDFVLNITPHRCQQVEHIQAGFNRKERYLYFTKLYMEMNHKIKGKLRSV